MNPKVDEFIANEKKWKAEFTRLRAIALDCQLTEELKWGVPCYTSGNKNIVLIHGFKEYCAILFVNGALLKDEKSILFQQTANTQSSRQIRFTDVESIDGLAATLKEYIAEAVEAERSGQKVRMKSTAEFNSPDEFKKKCDGDAAFKKAFDALTPGRQRAYLLHFSEPKQSKTREARIEKNAPRILAGKGLQDP